MSAPASARRDDARSSSDARAHKREAQARETKLHRALRDWNAAQPITVPGAATGKTEWYRGAYAVLQRASEDDAAQGRIVHASATRWWRSRLERERETLYEWATLMLRTDEPATEDGRTLLRDTLDAYESLDVALDDCLPQELMAAHDRSRAERSRKSGPLHSSQPIAIRERIPDMDSRELLTVIAPSLTSVVGRLAIGRSADFRGDRVWARPSI